MFSRPWASLGVRTADTCESGWRRESINSAPAIHAAGPVAAFVGDIGVSAFVPVIVERYGYGDWNYGFMDTIGMGQHAGLSRGCSVVHLPCVREIFNGWVCFVRLAFLAIMVNFNIAKNDDLGLFDLVLIGWAVCCWARDLCGYKSKGQPKGRALRVPMQPNHGTISVIMTSV